jgi:AAA domain
LTPGTATRLKTYPRAVGTNFANIPAELKQLAQWECWKVVRIDGKDRKVPINPLTGQKYPTGLTSEEMGCATFEQAGECFARDSTLAGIGWRFKKTDPYCGVDLDNCRDPQAGLLVSWADDLVKQFATYTEVSPSGTGVKLICRGKIPAALTKTDEIEMYCEGRYFALTGVSLNGAVIREAQEQLSWWYRLLTVKKEREPSATQALPGTKWKSGGEHYERLLSFVGREHYHDPSMTEDDGVTIAMQMDRARAEEPYPESKIRSLVRDIWKKVDAPPAPAPPVLQTPPVVWDSREFLEQIFPPREPFVTIEGFDTPVFTSHSINQIFAWRGTGKSLLVNTFAGCASVGHPFLNWKFLRPLRVLIVDGELPDAQIQERWRVLFPPGAHVRAITLDQQYPGAIPSLATPPGQQWLESVLKNDEVLILDSLASLAWFEKNDEEAWDSLLAWLMRLRSRGLCIVLLQQAGKAGLQRAHSRGDDFLDVQIKLTSDEEERDFMKCELTYEKFRGPRHGVRALNIECRQGKWFWSAAEADKLKLLEEYLCLHPHASVRTIENDLPELGSRMSIQRLMKKLEQA